MIAKLLASLAPLVKITSSDFTSNRSATCLVAASINFLASTPNLCKELGLPIYSKLTFENASTTSLLAGVVAL